MRTALRNMMAFAMMFLFVCGTAWGQGPADTIKVDLNFEHSATRFPLEGAHLGVTCETCHAGAIFKGVPTTCFGCHNGDTAKGKTDQHPATSNECSDCHVQRSWSAVHVDHGKIAGNCFSCHDGKAATGKHRLHVKSSRQCEDCHVVSTWSIARFDHAMTSEPCERCHDNQQASGKSFNHIRANNDCGSCHTSIAWNIGVFNHQGITTGCFTCHNGIEATGKSGSHMVTSDVCEACHVPVDWSHVKFDHSQAGDITTCVDCHDGRRATGRSSAHFKTTNDCQSCHTTLTWKPATFDHDLTLDVTSCFSCHNGNRPPADGKSTGHMASSNICTDCHSPTNFNTWAGAVFNHTNVTGGCFGCHNGNPVSGKTTTHLASSNTCESCHVTTTFADWKTSRFDHSQSSGVDCKSCHDGAQSISSGPIVGMTQGPAGRHMATTQACESCHNTTSFIPAMAFDHQELTVTACATCHNGTEQTSEGKLTAKDPAKHIASGDNCETCHNTTNWKSAVFDHANIGTARCDSCHNGVAAGGLSDNHLAFNGGADCLSCHTTVGWTVVTFDHSVVNTSCFSCHDGQTAISSGKLTSRNAQTHIASGNDCESCHTSFTSWKTAFNHANIGGATCVSCHNGVNATGKLSLSGKHVPTTDVCETCHTTQAWTPLKQFDHGQASTTTCFTCHNGTDASGKGRSHILSKDTCESCHTVAVWSPANMNHDQATGTCFSCHDGAHSTGLKQITGKTPTHFKTSNACISCHVTSAWKPAIRPFDHSLAAGTCFSCHDGNHAPAGTRSNAHVLSSTDCAQCHVNSAWAPANFSHQDTTVAATACFTCHDGSVANAQAKHAGHLPTSDLCADCHTTTAFTPARFDHNDPSVAGRACASCHDGTAARGQSASHIATGTQACNDCHTTASWATSGKPDHSGFANNCFTCHTGAPNATGKPQTHFATSNNCDVCHATTAFKPAAFNHAEATSTANCFACHDGAPAHAPAQGKSSFPAHPATSNECQTCHTGFSSWAGASFKHDDPVVAAAACFSCHDGQHAPAEGKLPTHFKAGNDCASCHVTLNWTTVAFDHTQAQGTCVSCHDNAHPPAAGKGQNHLQTSNVCEDCHTTAAWSSVTFDHTAVAGTACFTCHNGTRARGKGQTHFATTNTCDDCHTTTGWSPASFDHGSATSVTNCVNCHDGDPKHAPALGKSSVPGHVASSNDCQACHNSFASWATANFSHDDPVVAAAACFSCHDGQHSPAAGKSQTHFKSSNDCAACHTTTNWTTATFDHSQALGTCFSCHDGRHAPADGKGTGHVTSTDSCDSCHVTTNWTSVAFDHSQATGSCVNCHDGAHPPAAGKGPRHFVTAQPCEICHTSTAWTPVLPYTHMSSAYENHGNNVSTCTDCHKQSNEKISFARPDLAPDCAACHVNDFEQGPHKKYTSPTTKYYTVDELRDCTGACHIYSDQTMATIKTRRAGPEHRATGGF